MTASLKITSSLHHIEFCARDAPSPSHVIPYSNINDVKGQQQNCLPCNELTHTHTSPPCFFSFDNACNKNAGMPVRANDKQ